MVDRILAIKLAGLGDLLLCEPALRSLRLAYPEATIDVLTTPEAAELVPLLHPEYQTITFPKQLFDSLSPKQIGAGSPRLAALLLSLRTRRYDLAVLFHHLTTRAGAMKHLALIRAAGVRRSVGLDNGRGHFLDARAEDYGFGVLHEAEYMLSVATAAGGAPVAPAPRVERPDPESSGWLKIPHAVIYPMTGAYSDARNWPPERYIELIRLLETRGVFAVLVGGPDAVDAANAVAASNPMTLNFAGRFTLQQLARSLTGADVAIGGDTFIGHLAAAVGTPVVSIFGPTNHQAWRPYGSRLFRPGRLEDAAGSVVTADLPCSPCLYTGYRLGRPEGCPSRSCIAQVEVADVFAAAMAHIELSS